MHLASRIRLGAVIHGRMLRKILAHRSVKTAFVGVELAFLGNVFVHDFCDRNGVGTRHMEGPDPTATFDQ